jgi:hypothetical protein
MVLGETFRLFAGHLHLFTLISLTVCLPGHVLLNYFRFFDPSAESMVHALQAGWLIQTVFDPLAVAATLVALARIKRGLPVDYVAAIGEGAGAWGRLLAVRFVVNVALWLPGLTWVAIDRAGHGLLVVAGILLAALTGAILIVLVRCAVVDAVVVLGGGNFLTAWGRAAALTAGRRWRIVWAAAAVFGLLVGAVLLSTLVFRLVPALNHFVVRVLVDCALAVGQSLVTIALFLFYWQAAVSAAPEPASAPAV